MSDQFDIATIGMVQFERDPEPVRGTLYLCTLCGKRPAFKVKGVLSELLTGDERKRFKSNFNSLKRRHMKACQPSSTEAVASGGHEADGDAPSGTSVEAGNDEAGAIDAASSGVSDEEVIPVPPPLDPTNIARWTSEAVYKHLQYWSDLPANIDSMVWLPKQGRGNPRVDCHLRNEYGTTDVNINVTVIYTSLPALIDLVERSEERWKSDRHQEAVVLFERACAKSREAVCIALEAILTQ